MLAAIVFTFGIWHHHIWMRNLFFTSIINLWNIYFLIRNFMSTRVPGILWSWYSGNRVANALCRRQQVVDSLMLSEWNYLFIKFIGRFDILRFIELYLIFLWTSVRCSFMVFGSSDVLLLYYIDVPSYLDQWMYHYFTTSLFRFIGSLDVPFLYYVGVPNYSSF